MRTQASRIQTEQARHLSENLLAQLARGREWATPGVHAALQRAAAGLDTGLESASPRIQEAVRRLADDLAGGMETVTPRIHERLQRVAPKTVPPEPARSGRTAWVVAAILAITASLGVAAWRATRAADEIAPGVEARQAPAAYAEDDPESAAARI